MTWMLMFTSGCIGLALGGLYRAIGDRKPSFIKMWSIYTAVCVVWLVTLLWLRGGSDV